MKLHHVSYFRDETSALVMDDDAKETDKTLVIGNGFCVIKKSSETTDPDTGVKYYRNRGESYCRSERDALALFIGRMQKRRASIDKVLADANERLASL